MTVLADPTVQRVALVRLRVGLGDLLCSIPALRTLRGFRPDLRLTMVTWPEMAPVIDRMRPYVDELLPFPGLAGIPERPAMPAGWKPFIEEAHAHRFDVAVQCYGNNPVANRVTGALGARHVAGFAPNGWIPGQDGELHLPYPTDSHEVWRHLLMLRHLGVPVGPEDAAMEFPIWAEDAQRHQTLLARHGLVAGAYAVIHPGASSPSRRWPPERFAAVADALAADGLQVAVTGTELEASITSAVLSAMSARAVDLTAVTTLGGLAALLRECAILVGNDTGTAHLAAAVGAPTLTVFLPGDPVRWAHPGPENRVARVDVGCSPCPHLDCPIDHRCALSLTVDHVVALARRALSEAGRTSASP